MRPLSIDCHKIPHNRILRKSVQRDSRWQKIDRRTDTTELVGTLGDYAITPKILNPDIMQADRNLKTSIS